MKGRHGAAHFAAFPRPPNYPNRNPNEHTYTKEKKLKRILASVFLVLAVIAAVGIFGVQTSDRTEAHATALKTAGMDPVNRTIPIGRTHEIDLKTYVTHVPGVGHSTDPTASTTYSLGAFAGNPANVQFLDANGEVIATPNNHVLPDGIMRVRATGTSPGSTTVTWRADSTPSDNDPSDQGNTFDVVETMSVTTIAALTADPALPAVGATTRATTAPLASNALTSGTASPSVSWAIANFPAAQYVLEAEAEPTGIVSLSVSGGTLEITPVKAGTATISTNVVHTLGQGATPSDAAAAKDRWDFTDQEFTVTYARTAPPISIIANSGATPGTFDKTGEEGSEIVFTIRSDHVGDVGKFRTISRSSATYVNRNVIFGLTNSGNQDLFDIRTGDPYQADTGTGNENTATGSVTAVEATLSVAQGATLTPGQSYTFTVVANDQINRDGLVQAGGADSAEVTVNVVQGNRAPVLGTLPAIVIPDGSAVGADLLDLNGRANDPDRNELTYSVAAKAGSDNAAQFGTFFEMATADGAEDRFILKLKAAVDYDDVDNDGDTDDDSAATKAQKDAVRWTLTVTVTDGSLSDTQDVTVSVSDSGTAPPSQLTNVFNLPENSPRDTVLGPIGQSGQTWTNVTFNTDFGPDSGSFRLVTATATEYNETLDGTSIPVGTQGVLVVGGVARDGTAVNTDFHYEDPDPTDNQPVKRTYALAVSATDTSVSPSASRNTAVTVNITDVNEAPVLNDGGAADADSATPTPADLTATQEYVARVSENADVGDAVAYGIRSDSPQSDATFAVARGVTDQDAGDVLSYSLVAENSDGTGISDPEVAFSGPFAINASTGAITVTSRLDAETTASYELYVKVTDDDATNALFDTVKLTITVSDANELPYFVASSGSTTELSEVAAIEVNENTASPTVLATYYGYDPDGNDFEFVLRTSLDSDFFSLVAVPNNTDRVTLTPKAGRTLDYETKATYQVEIEIVDSQGAQSQILQTINLRNLNDNPPVWQQSHTALTTNENVARGTLLATYTATDADGDDITYSLSGTNGAQYQIGSADGMLKTLASLDAETNTSDSVTITASDGLASNNITVDTRISIGDVNDRIGSITVKMANPLLGPTKGDPNSALADRKTTVSIAVPEAPADLPATRGNAVDNFVETGAAGWGTTLRIEVLSVSPGATCGNGNQCVVIELEGDDSDDILNVMAYRNSDKDNLFVAAVMPVQSANDATPGTAPVYRHADGGVPRIKVDEEDTLRVKFGNLRDSVTIDNEAPEFSNFLPEHEASIDDDEVQYTFTVTDAISGIPEPEDLPDNDGDDAYMAVAALVNTQQCHNVADGASAPSGTTMVPDTNLHEGAQIYCPTGSNPRVRDIVDDKDLDSVTDGFEVDTEVVLSANQISFVTFIACDAAGNCVAFDPDENDTREALAEITVDTIAPDLSQARTGVMWDAADNKYDDSRSFIQAIFTDLSKLNPDTIEADDFVVDGYTIKRVYWYDDPDAEDENWGTRYDTGSGSRAYREISKTVFIELEEELLPDATPDVSVVPNGLEDEAGKEQDDDEVEADDWIAPKFAVQSITSPLETSRDNVLVGEDQKVVLTVTSDERISTTKPLVDVDYVNAPAGCVDRAGIILRAGRDTDGDGRLEPGESRADCAVNAKGASLNSVISKDGTNEWTITVDKPSATGYYNVYIYADDRSSQNNRGSEGVAPADIVTKFFEKDGDVNADDAVFFEGDVQLPKPQVVVSGEDAGDTEPTVEFKSPLFIEVDFTEPFSADCSAGDKLSNKLECTAESAEYAEDGFDAVTITRFELNGVDMTDDVKTTDDETFLVALDDVGIGDHELKIQATDVAGNELKDVLEIEFEVEERDPFTRRLNPGWNLVSLPGSPADSAIASVFGSDIEVRTVYTYNPVTPGGWQVAVRETLDDAWQGDLTDITAKSGYWVLSDAIQDLEVSIPRLAGGAVGASTPVQPPVIPMYAGWNLIPVVDVTGDALDTKKSINATTYLNSLDDGLDLARVLGFNTITNEWFTVIDPSDASVTDNLQIGSAYWVFVRESASLVPGGIPR